MSAEKQNQANNPSTADGAPADPIRVTPAAIRKIKAMMEKEGKEGYGLRFGVKTGGCAGFSYEMSFQKKSYDNDIVATFDGVSFFINAESLPFVKGIEIDYIDTLKESGFKYKNPNAQSSCGCGLSFS